MAERKPRPNCGSGNTAQRRASERFGSLGKIAYSPVSGKVPCRLQSRSRLAGPAIRSRTPRSKLGAARARSEIRLMEAAIALAEELSFSRAGYRLGVTQPVGKPTGCDKMSQAAGGIGAKYDQEDAHFDDCVSAPGK